AGMAKEAVKALEKLHPSGEVGGRGFGMLGATYVRAGRRADALKLLDQVRHREKWAYVSPVSVAQIYLGLGDHDRAFEWLEKGYRARDATMTALGVEPAYDPIRGDPRFRSLVRRLNLN
ncbi:MAG: tetratricopeptide repeat protein, partial [Bryobacteraceae bacterium]